MHTSTTGHQASILESRILVWESKDRYRAIWKTRERLRSPRRRPCDCQRPPGRYYTSRPDRTQSWALLSRFQAAHQARFERQAADRLHRSYRPSALSYLHQLPRPCVINGGPLFRDWVDDPCAMPQDLDGLAISDEQAWLSQRQEYFRY